MTDLISQAPLRSKRCEVITDLGRLTTMTENTAENRNSIYLKLRQAKFIASTREITRTSHTCRKWFKVIAWSLEKNPDGLFLNELKNEYKELCKITDSAPYTDDGDFQGSLSRQLEIALAISHKMGWLSFHFEKPSRIYPNLNTLLISPERLWKIDILGRKANSWPNKKLERAISIFMLRERAKPFFDKIRLPLAAASGTVGIIKVISGWGHIQTMLEAAIAIVGAFVLALIGPTHHHPPT